MLMIAASLIAIASILGLLWERQASADRTSVRNQGVSLVRTLSKIPFEQLVPKSSGAGLLPSILQLPGNASLGYGVVVNPAGKTLTEVTSPGTLVPSASYNYQPDHWFGEQELASTGDGRKIRE